MMRHVTAVGMLATAVGKAGEGRRLVSAAVPPQATPPGFHWPPVAAATAALRHGLITAAGSCLGMD